MSDPEFRHSGMITPTLRAATGYAASVWAASVWAAAVCAATLCAALTHGGSAAPAEKTK